MPGLEEAAVADGVATIGLELADDLPAEIASVLVSPFELAAPLRDGLIAAGRDCEVRGESCVAGDDLRSIADLVLGGLRVASEPAGLAALLPMLGVMDAPPTCVGLSQ